MRRRILRHAVPAAAAVLATLLTTIAAPATAALAASSSASHVVTQTAGVRSQAAPLSNIVVSYAGPAINRKGCGTTVNPSGLQPDTFVIGWKPDRDPCEDAEIVSVPSMCGHGTVTLTCGMPSVALDQRYNRRPLVVVVFYNESYRGSPVCLAAAPDTAGVLGVCPSASGVGGAVGTIYAWSSLGYLVSRHWSFSNIPLWLCNDSGGYGQALDTGSDGAGAGDCQWDNAGIPGSALPLAVLGGSRRLRRPGALGSGGPRRRRLPRARLAAITTGPAGRVGIGLGIPGERPSPESHVPPAIRYPTHTHRSRVNTSLPGNFLAAAIHRMSLVDVTAAGQVLEHFARSHKPAHLHPPA